MDETKRLEEPQPVYYDVVDEDEWNELVRYRRQEDDEAFIKKAVELSYENIPLFAYLFLGLDIAPHFVDYFDEAQKYDRSMFLQARSHSKCGCPETDVILGDMTKKKVKDVKPGDEVVSFSGDLTQETDVVVAKEENEKELFRLESKVGRVVKATEEHRFLTFDGWKTVKEIKPGEDYIAMPSKYSNDGHGDLAPEEATLLAIYLAEGCKAMDSFQFSNGNEDITKEVKRCAEALGYEVSGPHSDGYTHTIKVTDKDPRKLLKENNIKKYTTYNVQVPDSVFRAKKQTIAKFLATIFGGDGYVAMDAGNIGYSSASEQLVDDLQDLLLQFGITGTRCTKPGVFDGEEYETVHVLTIGGKENIQKFKEEVGILGKEDQLEKLYEQTKDWEYDTSEWKLMPPSWRDLTEWSSFQHKKAGDKISNNYRTTKEKVRRVAEREENEQILNLLDSPIEWIEVESIESVGESKVYDIETEEYHNFVADGFVSHNSSMIAQALPIHHICYSTIPDTKYEDVSILLIQESASAAKATVKAIREEFETGGASNLIHLAFGDDISDKATKWNEDTINLPSRKSVSKDHTLYGAGPKGDITGMHPDIVIMDDVVTKENSKTQHLRQELWDFWAETIVGTLNRDSQVYVLGTRYYHGDLYDRLIKKQNQFHVVERPALTIRGKPKPPRKNVHFNIEEDDNGVVVDIELTPRGVNEIETLWGCPFGVGNCPYQSDEHYDLVGEHRPAEWLILQMLEDRTAFQSQYLLKIVGSGEHRFKEPMMNFYDPVGEHVGDYPPYDCDTKVAGSPRENDLHSIVHAWDLAVGKNSENDNTAFARAIRTTDNDVFFDVQAGKWDFEEIIDLIESKYMQEKRNYTTPRAIVVESQGFQKGLSDSLHQRSREILPLEPVSKTKDKDTYLVESGLLTALKNGKVWLNMRDEQTINELLSFTPSGGEGASDDRVDAMAMAFTYIREHSKDPVRVINLRSKKRKGYSKHRSRFSRRGQDLGL
jgi:predicted phage terminase large subunit-like protein